MYETTATHDAREARVPRVWLVGWEEIEQATGMTRKVLKPLITEAALPVRYIGGRPVTTATQLERWVAAGVGG
ncbi:hypothetical protein [Nitratidesulfovibrio vulgaris]|uniref:hypothetical protein n=1 Tax=Nitratidesulfovibrio vulgaris TaxID=881 RepID=UPI002300F600|nr:hypothetical protein [Nitratidesulfovibrio vulgaris]WCB45260.1 hypothetical protein PH214_09205 [Nitratidesulfovibrio vulgaris]